MNLLSVSFRDEPDISQLCVEQARIYLIFHRLRSTLENPDNDMDAY